MQLHSESNTNPLIRIQVSYPLDDRAIWRVPGTQTLQHKLHRLAAQSPCAIPPCIFQSDPADWIEQSPRQSKCRVLAVRRYGNNWSIWSASIFIFFMSPKKESNFQGQWQRIYSASRFQSRTIWSWSGKKDLNFRSPAPKAGEDGRAPLLPDNFTQKKTPLSWEVFMFCWIISN